MDKLNLTKELQSFIQEKCSEWRFYNIVVYLKSDCRKTNAEVISKILEVNPDFSIQCIDSNNTKDDKDEATIVFNQTGFKGG
jgi:hypothetical protein